MITTELQVGVFNPGLSLFLQENGSRDPELRTPDLKESESEPESFKSLQFSFLVIEV